MITLTKEKVKTLRDLGFVIPWTETTSDGLIRFKTTFTKDLRVKLRGPFRSGFQHDPVMLEAIAGSDSKVWRFEPSEVGSALFLASLEKAKARVLAWDEKEKNDNMRYDKLRAVKQQEVGLFDKLLAQSGISPPSRTRIHPTFMADTGRIHQAEMTVTLSGDVYDVVSKAQAIYALADPVMLEAVRSLMRLNGLTVVERKA